MTMKPPFVRSALNYDMNKKSERSVLRCLDKSLAQQEFKEETDINYIADRYGLTGELPQVLQLPAYGDFTGIFDFQSAQNAVVEARQQFMTLPAKLRARFQNSPQQLLEFLEDPENRKEAIAIGLLQEPPQSPPGEPAAKGEGETPTPKPKAAGEPQPKATPTPKTDT